MPHFCLDEAHFNFPSVADANEEGLLLVGGRVTSERVIEAYQKGIFPWYNQNEVPLWWSPDPRFILFPNELHVSRSMKKMLAKNLFDFKTNTEFENVIDACATSNSRQQSGTWITTDMKQVYTDLFRAGYAHCAEAWSNDGLVGGLYGIRLGNVFFAESMFHTITNASKFVMIKYVQHLKQAGITLIDCQVYSAHVESLGARLITRKNYLALLQKEAAQL